MKSQAALAVWLILATGATGAAEAPPEVDAEFLEFLGSLDTEDEEWREYLAERPVRTEAGKPAAPPAGQTGRRNPPSSQPEREQEKVKKP